MIAIRYRKRIYSAHKTPKGNIIVQALGHVDIKQDEVSAYAWLGGRGLRRGRIQRLLDAAIRNTGEFADPKHPRRVPLAEKLHG